MKLSYGTNCPEFNYFADWNLCGSFGPIFMVLGFAHRLVSSVLSQTGLPRADLQKQGLVRAWSCGGQSEKISKQQQQEYSGLPKCFPTAWPNKGEPRWAILLLLLFARCLRHPEEHRIICRCFYSNIASWKNPTRSPSHSVSLTERLSDVHSSHSAETPSQPNLVTVTVF
ncbi:protein LZIC isoform 2-T5 [Cyanocitta cristata]